MGLLSSIKVAGDPSVEVPHSHHPVVVQPPQAKRAEFPFTGFIDFQGLKIDVENKRGDYRRGKDKDGHEWKVLMHNHYGEIRDTEGVDGDNLDVYVGPNHDASTVVVIRQHRPDTGAFDEDKVMVGFDSVEEAIGAYKKQYDKPGFYKDGDYLAMPIGRFWRWVHDEKKQGKKVASLLGSLKVAQDSPDWPDDGVRSMDEYEYVIRGGEDATRKKAAAWGLKEHQWEMRPGDGGLQGFLRNGEIRDLDWFVSTHKNDLFRRPRTDIPKHAERVIRVREHPRRTRESMKKASVQLPLHDGTGRAALVGAGVGGLAGATYGSPRAAFLGAGIGASVGGGLRAFLNHQVNREFREHPSEAAAFHEGEGWLHDSPELRASLQTGSVGLHDLIGGADDKYTTGVGRQLLDEYAMRHYNRPLEKLTSAERHEILSAYHPGYRASLRSKQAEHVLEPARPDTAVVALRSVLTCLLALYQLYYFAHWTARGKSFYSDHELFTRLYKSTQGEFDQVAERAVGHLGNNALDGVFTLAAAKNADWVSSADSPLQAAWLGEQELLRTVLAAYRSLDAAAGLTLGLDDLLMQLASAHETNTYLLRQRIDEPLLKAAHVIVAGV